MENNIFPFQGSIKQSDRHCLNGHRSALVWFTGLSGSGKSTLAHALEERLFNMGIRSYVLGNWKKIIYASCLPFCPTSSL